MTPVEREVSSSQSATSGSISSASSADGTLMRQRDGYRACVLDTWSSSSTQARYPSRWRISVPSAQLVLEIAPLVADCELDTSRSTGVIYWEGPIEVAPGGAGRGYAEFVGYAGTLAGRF